MTDLEINIVHSAQQQLDKLLYNLTNPRAIEEFIKMGGGNSICPDEEAFQLTNTYIACRISSITDLATNEQHGFSQESVDRLDEIADKSVEIMGEFVTKLSRNIYH